MFARSPAYWEHDLFHDPEHSRRGESAAWYAVHEVAGEAHGYARYRTRESWDDAGPKSAVILTELMATNPAAHADLWRYLLDIDLMARLDAWNIVTDDPIFLQRASATGHGARRRGLAARGRGGVCPRRTPLCSRWTAGDRAGR
jgi:predicted acetyltransferase